MCVYLVKLLQKCFENMQEIQCFGWRFPYDSSMHIAEGLLPTKILRVISCSFRNVYISINEWIICNIWQPLSDFMMPSSFCWLFYACGGPWPFPLWRTDPIQAIAQTRPLLKCHGSQNKKLMPTDCKNLCITSIN